MVGCIGGSPELVIVLSSSSKNLRDLADVSGTRAAASADDLSAGGEPLRGLDGVGFRIAGANPATMLGIPAFTGVGIDEDGLV